MCRGRLLQHRCCREVPPPLTPTPHPHPLARPLAHAHPHPHTTPDGCYLLFDLPGQVELFTLHGSLRRILDMLTRKWGYRLACVQLVDAHLCRCGRDGWPVCGSVALAVVPVGGWRRTLAPADPHTRSRLLAHPTPPFPCPPQPSPATPPHPASDPAKYLSALLLSLSTMLHLELPQVRRGRRRAGGRAGSAAQRCLVASSCLPSIPFISAHAASSCLPPGQCAV